MTKPIVLYPNPILRKTSEEVTKEDNLQELLKDMNDALSSTEKGVGLSAIQIGIPLRVFIGSDGEVFVNPEIIERKGADRRRKEGCLSIPDVWARVKRKQKVRIKWYDESWEQHEALFKGTPARIIQHEFDHLEGKLFIDYVQEGDKEPGYDYGLGRLKEGKPPEKPYKMLPYKEEDDSKS